MKHSAVLFYGSLLLLAAACGGDAAPPGSSDGIPTTTATPTTASPAPTTTSSPSPTVPPLADDLFVVVGVAPGDVLNVRSEPNAAAEIVGTLEPGAPVSTTGLATPDAPTAGWWEVTVEDGATGWANRRFIGLGPKYQTPLSELPCGAVSEVAATSPEASSNADHVLAVALEHGADCDRVVVVLGTHSAAPEDWPEDPADSVPGGVTVAVEDTVAVVSFPAGSAGGSVDLARPTAVEASFRDAEAFVVRSFAPAGAPAIPVSPEVRVHFHRNVTAAATFLADPARIVVDVYPAPTGTGLDLAPVIGDGTVLDHPVQADLAGPGVTLPLTVSGYGRPFEAQGVAQLRTVASSPGAGELVQAEYSGPSGTVTGDTYPYTATDWTTMWGRFSFTFDGLAPGTYELFVGEFSPRDGEPRGVYDVFTVAG